MDEYKARLEKHNREEQFAERSTVIDFTDTLYREKLAQNTSKLNQ